MQLNVIDILFVVTVALLVINGLRNGAIFSLINLLGIPLGFGVAFYFGPQFTALLAANHLPATPLISYLVLFFGTVLVLHIIGSFVRGVIKSIPVIGFGDSLLGAVIGFGEAWLLWLILLIVLGNFLGGLQGTVNSINHTASVIPGFHISFDQLKGWHDFYNQAVSNSLFARINSIFNQNLSGLPQLPKG